MSVYLLGSSVLLDGSGNVGTNQNCCCTGACCLPDSTCEIATPAKCATDGGMYLGNGTSCSPNPCSIGECCLAHITCQDLTQFDCNNEGGKFQGNGTKCPTPCCCPHYFLAFDGSGRRFTAYSGSMTGNHTRSQFQGGLTLTLYYQGASDYAAHYDSSCTLVVDQNVCSSSRTQTPIPDNCSLSDLECFCNSGSPPLCSNFCIGFFAWECGFCGGGDCGSDNTVITATTQVRTVVFCQHCTDGSGHPCDISGSYLLSETLSNECLN